ncbi:MAG: class I SAM-dependent methyltransferase [Lachnospiraceae bacterium]|nr:class I SAM-dependent methyltransferase [Lachnospiraceae bacterium]
MKNDEFEDNWPLFERFLGYLRYLKIRKYITMVPKPVCVDIGCGFNGRFLRSISKKIRRGYGIDIRANEAVYGNVRIVNNSRFNGRLPIKDDRVDRVFMLAVLEHLDADSCLVEEGARVIKEGGYFILTTPTPFSKPILEFLSFKLHLISVESIEEHKHYWTEKELKDKMEACGLKVIKYKKFQCGCNQLIVAQK